MTSKENIDGNYNTLLNGDSINMFGIIWNRYGYPTSRYANVCIVGVNVFQHLPHDVFQIKA